MGKAKQTLLKNLKSIAYKGGRKRACCNAALGCVLRGTPQCITHLSIISLLYYLVELPVRRGGGMGKGGGGADKDMESLMQRGVSTRVYIGHNCYPVAMQHFAV